MPVVIQPHFPVMVLPQQSDRLVDAPRIVLLRTFPQGSNSMAQIVFPLWIVKI